jgi:PAS domain S-box-containing protein
MNKARPKAFCVALPSALGTQIEAQLGPEFACHHVPSAEEARALLNSEADCALLFTVHSASEPAGFILQQDRHRQWPDTVGVMFVEEAEVEIALTALQDGTVDRVVRAPWRAETLAKAVADARDYFELRNDERRLREQLARINAELDEKIQDLDEANELLEYWVEFSPAVLYSFSCERGALHPSYISKNFFRLTGYERTAAVVDANFWRDLIHPGDAVRYREALAGLTSDDGNFAVVEYRVRHRDGTYLNIVDSMRAVRDGDGDTIEVVGAWLDVSARA